MTNKVAFTAQQQTAIETRTSEILVSAAAGSGKTAVLVERIIFMILEEQIPIDKLVVLTFTNAAALQMKERIRLRLQKIVPELQGKQKEFIEQQLLRLPLATICTFHAYCIQILRKYYQYVHLAPGFKIAEENSLTLLKQEAMYQTLEMILAEDNHTFRGLIDFFVTGTKINKLEKIILAIYEQTRSYAFIDQWMQRALAYVEDEEMIVLLIEAYETSYFEQIKDSLNQFDDLQKLLFEFPKHQEMLQQVREAFADFTDLSYEDSMHQLMNFTFPKWPAIKKDMATLESQHAHQQYNKIKKNIVKLLKSAITPEEIAKQQANCAPIVKQLLEVIKIFETNFMNLKNKKDLVDFSDLEHYMIKLLSQHEGIRKSIASNIVELLIDEYQDTNEVQDTILQYLKQDKNRLFMVGDVKQSIYRFRLADPTIFLKKKATYQIENKQDQELILLNKNFRSSANILDTANIIFEKLFKLDIKYDDDEKLYLGNQNYNLNEQYTKWHFFNSELSTETITIQTEAEKKATVIVNEIITLLNNETIYDEKIQKRRRIKLNDIAILFRSRGSDLITALERKLEEAKLHYISESDKGYFDAVEVNVMLALLNVLENPYNSISLLGYLRSPICAFTDEELYQIAQFYQQSDEPESDKFYQYILYYQAQNDFEDPLVNKITKTLEIIALFKTKMTVLPLSNVLEFIYDTTFYYNFVSALPNGQIRCANLRILVDIAKTQEEIGRNGIYAFNKYMRNLQRNNRDFAVAKPENSTYDMLNMMTIHKSKGLEFPIVFLIDLDKKFNEQDLRSNYQMSKTYGLALQYHDIEKHIRYKTWHYEYIANQVKFDMLAEELRVLYVALTRPMQNLHLFLEHSDTIKTLNSIQDILSLHNYGDALRSIYDENKHLMTTWQTENINLDVSILLDKVETKNEQLKRESKDKNLSQTEITDIIAKMQWKYPYMNLQNYAQKQTVTELKQRLDLQNDPLLQPFIPQILEQDNSGLNPNLYDEVPTFMQKAEQDSPLKKGTLYHLIFQYYDWNVMPDVDVFLTSLVTQKIITKTELQSLNQQKISDTIAKVSKDYFFQGYQVVAKELPFSFQYPATEIYQEAIFTNETLLVQGKIDLLLMKDNTYVVIDFKTDKLNKGQNITTLEKRYAKQLELYQEAVRKFYQTKQVETKIYAIFS